MQNFDLIIIGGGAAGLMCAGEAVKRGRRVVVMERAAEVAQKIHISGDGRANFTNLYASPADYLSENPRFCISALSRYTQHDFITLVEKHHIAYHQRWDVDTEDGSEQFRIRYRQTVWPPCGRTAPRLSPPNLRH